jgi:hypothetical protein
MGEKYMVVSTYGDHGAIVVCGDYAGDLEKIVSVLNQWTYDSFDGKKGLQFAVHKGRIKADRFDIESPHLFPYRVWVRFNDGRRIAWEDTEEDLYEGECEFEEEEFDLETISKKYRHC